MDGGVDWVFTTGKLVGADVGGTTTWGPATDHTTQLSEGKVVDSFTLSCLCLKSLNFFFFLLVHCLLQVYVAS